MVNIPCPGKARDADGFGSHLGCIFRQRGTAKGRKNECTDAIVWWLCSSFRFLSVLKTVMYFCLCFLSRVLPLRLVTS